MKLKNVAIGIGILALAGFCMVVGGIVVAAVTLPDNPPAQAVLSDEEINYDTPIDQLTDDQIIALDHAAMTATAEAEPAATQTRPAPTATEESSLSMEDGLAIIEWMTPVENSLMLIGDLGTDMGAQFQMMADNPYVIMTDSWINDTAFIFAMLDAEGQSLIDSKPPTVSDPELNSLLQRIDSKLEQCGRELVDGVDDYIYGLDNIEVDYIERGNNHIVKSTEFVIELSALLQEATAYVDNL